MRAPLKPCLLLAICLTVVSGLSRAAALEYPDKPVRLVVPFAPGGGTDIVARIVAQKLTEVWEKQVVVDNRGGAGGVIGTEMVARAPANGYTILFGAQSTLAMNPAVYRNLKFEPVRDFTPVTLVAYSLQLLAVHPGIPAKSLGEFIAAAKAAPGKWTYGSSGVGTSAHLTFELFKREAGISLVHVPYKGTAPAITDLLGGQIQAIIGSTAALLQHVRSGRLRAIAMTSGNRSTAMPQVPTMAESGLPGFNVSPWFGLLYPAGTPKTIVNALYSDMRKILNSPDTRQKIADQGGEPALSDSPRQFAAYVASERELWRKVVRENMSGDAMRINR
ncbi:MAG: tripartite tricarboxylate transporter substrate binding protein [Betaproteobacteria bacterium]|nr:tripartite tricarboxylate transporter substrate binding protein [Betaproteobacteria bacterium]